MAVRPRKIVVGYDGSEAGRRALEVAADLAGYGSTLSVVTVRTRDLGPSIAQDARERLLRRHVEARYLEPTGEPAETLVETARELDADLVVVGRRDHNALQRLLMLGSVSAKVVRRASCDVLVVR
jgi:nucleotide-binding universal stress UspA family protein